MVKNRIIILCNKSDNVFFLLEREFSLLQSSTLCGFCYKSIKLKDYKTMNSKRLCIILDVV